MGSPKEGVSRLDTVRVYIVEEQQIYRELYKTLLPSTAPIQLLRVSTNGNKGALLDAISELRPNVVVLSIKKLNTDVISELEKIRVSYPEIGVVLLLVFFSAQDADSLRKLVLKGKGGMALCFKQSLDDIEQLSRTILAVSQGQVILDPSLASIVFAGKPEYPFLKQLTARELEILDLLSKGYTNLTIAKTLYIDVKTVEHHLNNLYSKLKTDSDFDDKHLRVSAAKLYLETTGGLEHEYSFAQVAS